MAGRPTIYTQDLGNTICERVSDGDSLRSICDADDMPHRATVFRWLSANEKFRDQYARAKEESAECYADEITYIADTEDDVQRAKVRIDARKWVASKLKPKRYGDKVTQEISGPGGEPIQVIKSDMSPEEAAEIYQDIIQ